MTLSCYKFKFSQNFATLQVLKSNLKTDLFPASYRFDYCKVAEVAVNFHLKLY